MNHVSRVALLAASLIVDCWSVAAADSGCGHPPAAGGPQTLVHAGVTRQFAVHVPPGYDGKKPTPVVVAFHGWGGDGSEFLAATAVTTDADTRGYIVVAPRGLGSGDPDRRNNSWTFRGSASGVAPTGAPVCEPKSTPDYRYPSCRNGAAKSTCSWTQCEDDDVDFTVALVARVSATWCVDPQRVYAVGGSNGGMFVWELVQNPKTASLFRAVAPIVGLPHRGYLDPPAGSSATPVILITGRRDPVVPPGAWDDPAATTTSNDQDRFYYTGATAIARTWATAAGCAVGKTEARLAIGAPQADCRSYCDAGSSGWPRVLDCRADMGHDYGLGWSWKLVMDFFDRQ